MPGWSSSPGLVARIALFVLLFVTLACFVFMSIFTDGNSSLELFVCNTTNPSAVPIQCLGISDNSTCTSVEGVLPQCVQSACGYKLAAGIDISVSGADALTADPTRTDVLAGFMIFWGIVPYAMFFTLFATFLFAGDTSSLSFIGLLGCLTIVNEGLLKHTINQRRPVGSCLYFKSYGMPSGHATTSIGVLVNLLLEIWIDREGSRLFTLRNRCLWTVILLFLLLPVPFSRVYLSDHYVSQVLIGSINGTVLAVAWFFFMYKFVKSRLNHWIEYRCCKYFFLRNTYRMKGIRWTPEWARCDSNSSMTDLSSIESTNTKA